jgi:hypothetical protein
MGLRAVTLREGAEAMAEETSSQPRMATKIVPLAWSEPAGMAVFANQAMCQYDGNVVFLTFGQANPPIILGETEEEKQQQLDKVQSIAVASVVRLVMAPASFRTLVEAFQKHLAMIDQIDHQMAKQGKT